MVYYYVLSPGGAMAATGTGWEVSLNKIVGTSNTDILEKSTEVADHAKEQAIREPNVVH